MSNVLICGSRSVKITPEDIDEVLERHNISVDTVISGMAKGPDTVAIKWAAMHNISTIVFRPEWKKFGKSAGIRRNKKMVDLCDVCIAFWDFKSKGTKSTLDYAREKGKKRIIIDKKVYPSGIWILESMK